MKEDWPVWATEPIHIADPDPKWLEQGRHQAAQLHAHLTRFDILEVEHIGSTSVPNLPAKPIIDLMAKAESFAPIPQIAEYLGQDGWHYVPPHLDNRPWRRFFVKVKDDKRMAHLHIMLTGEKRWEQQRMFRDRLRENPRLTTEYARLKRTLAQQMGEDREAYTKAKTRFVARVLEGE